MAGPTTIFQRRRLSLWLHLVFWSALGTFGAAMATYIRWFAAMEPYAGHISFAVALILAAVSANYVLFAARELRAAGPAIVIGPGGLHDRRISEQPVPWDAVARVRAFRVRGHVVMFDIAAGRDTDFGVRPGPLVKSAVKWLLGFPAYDLIQMGTDASPGGLVAAIQPFVPVDG